jgi:AraC-like DNA-binding protein
LYRQIVEQDRLTDELESERKNSLDLIFVRLTTLMREQRLFTQPEVKRKDIAQQIGLSDRSLHDCIKKNTNLSFMEYVNTLRLSYARELLSNTNEKPTIDAIATESGFTSRTTFYRLFTDKYGLTPRQFRDAVASP